MAARPCPISLCDCPQADSPVTNISAEAPDPLLFWGQIWNPYDPFSPPRLGNGLDIKADCGPVNDLIALYNPIVYAGTQLLANLEALAASLGCPWPPSGEETFANSEQTQTVYCPDGSSFSYTVEAGTLVSPPMDPVLGEAWLAWANAWAAAYAFQQASAIMDCIERPEQPAEDAPGDTPPTGGGGTPLLSTDPYWCCFGDTLVDALNTYTIGGRGAQEYTISITEGAVPPGTTFTQTGPRSALLSGTPTSAGFFFWRIRAVSTSFPTTTIEVVDNLFVFGITNKDTLPDGETGTAYSEVLTSAGGTAPYTYALDTGSALPGGLTLAADGTISGTPTEDGAISFDVVVTDANGGSCVQTVSMFIAEGGIDWSTMVWVTSKTGGGIAVSLVVPAVPGGIQDNCQTYIQAPGSLSSASAHATGTLNYNGPAVPISFDGTIIRDPAGTNPPENQVLFLNITTQIGANPAVTQYVISGDVALPPGALPAVTGPFSFPYTIPDTGGQNCVITVDCFASNVSAFGPAYEQNITVTISNV